MLIWRTSSKPFREKVDGVDQEAPEPKSSEQRFAESQSRRAKMKAAFIPAGTMPELMLQVVGAWTSLTSEVNLLHFHSVGPNGPPTGKGLPATIRAVAERNCIRWPHDQWSLVCIKADKIRQQLAHFVYIDSISGDRPHRTVNLVLLGQPGAPRIINRRPGELSWRDKNWTQQSSYLQVITEDTLRQTLEGIDWMIKCCRYMNYLGNALNRDGIVSRSDDPAKALSQRIPWWLKEWGPRELDSVVTFRQLTTEPLKPKPFADVLELFGQDLDKREQKLLREIEGKRRLIDDFHSASADLRNMEAKATSDEVAVATCRARVQELEAEIRELAPGQQVKFS